MGEDLLFQNAILGSMLSVLQLSGGGIWTASPVRWLVGKFAFLLLLAVAVWIVGLFLPPAGLNWGIVTYTRQVGVSTEFAKQAGMSVKRRLKC